MRYAPIGLALMMTTSTAAFGQSDPPLNVAEWQSAIEILTGAREEIVKNDWQHGDNFPNPRAAFMAVAMERSWKQLNKTMVDFDYAKLAMNRVIDAPAISSLAVSGDPLATPYWGRYYMYWNDAPSRKKEEVLSALDKAIQYAAKQKEEAGTLRKTGNDLDEYDKKMMLRLGFR